MTLWTILATSHSGPCPLSRLIYKRYSSMPKTAPPTLMSRIAPNREVIGGREVEPSATTENLPNPVTHIKSFEPSPDFPPAH